MSMEFISVRGPESTTFSWPRWRRLARAHWAEQRSTYLGHLLVCSLLYIALLLFMLGVSGFAAFQTSMQAALYFGGLFLTGFVFAGRYFSAVARRESALLALMRPASVFEKWALCVVVVAIAYPLAYSLLFLAISWPVQQAAIAVRSALEPQAFKPEDYALFMPLAKMAARQAMPAAQQTGLLIAVWTLQAFAVAGSLYFGRASLLKTLALGFALFVSTALVASMAGAQGDVLFAWWSSRRFASLDAGIHALNALLWIGLPALLWLQAYLHLQEKELL